MLVCIDPGHGGRDPGAISKNGKHKEKNNTLRIARAIHGRERYLQGVRFCYTRLADEHLAEDTTADLQSRCDFANKYDAGLFISIHQNADANYRGRGVETFSLAETGEGRKLAKAIQNQFVKQTELINRGIKTANWYVLRETKMPAVLIEAGFVGGDPAEADYVSHEDNIIKIAEAILKGLGDYLGIEYKEPELSPFPDVPINHWALGDIKWCKEQGYLGGFPDGTFRGDEPLTRYQTAVLLRKLKG